MHPLLCRQLRKAFPHAVAPELERLLGLVDAAYLAADDDRAQLERSLFLASDELYERNRRLQQELEERKRLEVELQHAEKLRAVGQLAAGVAHEINTPVQFIGDSLSFLVDAFGEIDQLLARVAVAPGAAAGELTAGEFPFLREEIPRALTRSREGVDRVATIVRALKTLAHPDGTDARPADLAAAIHNTLIVVSNEVKYVADVELDLASTRSVRCFIGEIQQVLLNLIVNASHAIAERLGPSGGRGKIRIATRDDGPDVVLTIADDGAGIPPKIRDRIFEPFFTTKPIGKGSGQGLSIVHALVVDRQAGRIVVDSVVGEGTTFSVYLPVAGRPTAAGARVIA